MYIYKDKHVINKRDIKSDQYTAWDSPIKYQIENGLTGNVIKKAISEIEKNTCLKFEESDLAKNNTQGIVFKLGSYCASYVGWLYSKNTQAILLTKECSKNIGLVLHELGHALGLVHEQSRTDRDKYVEVAMNNIETKEQINFLVRNLPIFKNFSVYYDYSSIMHYGPYDFATGSTAVLKSNLHSEYDRMMGQRSNMTFNDFKQLNLAHCDKCNVTKTKKKKGKRGKKEQNGQNGQKGQNRQKEKRKSKNPCLNGGYPDYNACSKCICPSGYTGSECNDIKESDPSCGDTKFKATNELKYYGMVGAKKCHIFLLADEGKKINIGIYYTYARSKKICTEDVSHQVKYLADKGTTGLLLCSWRRDVINVTSELNSVLIIYNGQDSNHFIQLGYKQVDEVLKI